MPSQRNVRVWTSLVASLSVLAVAGFVRADSNNDIDNEKCRDFSGAFSSAAVPVPPCTSPIGLCTHGTLGPDFPGTYDAVFTALFPAGDPNDPTKFFYTGVSTITPGTGKNVGKFGVMTSVDTGVIHIPGNGAPNPFVTTANINAGTKRFKHVTGTFIASGTFDFQTGQATGSYTAHLCKDRPHGCDDDDD